jgi:hypothetical protein
MDCQQALNELGPLIDGELPAAERAEVEAHLAECDGCRAACAALRADDAELLRAFQPQRTAGARLADRLVDQLRAEHHRRTRWQSWAVLLVAAAAGFLLAVLIFQPSLRRGPSPSRTRPLARLALATGPTEVRAPRAVSWLTCPPQGEIDAGATVRTTDGARCELEASDGAQLRLDEGTVVELPTPGCVKLAQGELFSAVPFGCPSQKIEMPEAVIETSHGKLDVSCSPGKASLTVIEGQANLECKSGVRQVAAGQYVRLTDGQIEESTAVADPLQATAWINELLVLKGPDNPELAERLNDILAQVGQAKLSYLYEDEIRRLGSRAALPLLRFIESPRSRTNLTARVSAARLAADLADSSVVGDLIALLADDDANVRVYAAQALQRLTGTNQGRPADEWQEDAAACQPTLDAWRAWWQSRQSPSPAPGNGNPRGVKSK